MEDIKNIFNEVNKKIDIDIKKLNIKDVNVFTILELENTEIRHSNFLAWLFNTSGSHCLEDRILKDFIENIKKENKERFINWKNVDYNSFIVNREKEHIDLLLISEKEKKVICIENKIEAVEHQAGKSNKKQTFAYREKIEEEFCSYDKKFIFLTATKQSPEDGEWIAVNYQIIYEILKKILSEDSIENDNVKYLLYCYIDVLKIKNYIEDIEFQKECHKFYNQYKEIWKLVERNNGERFNFIYEEINNYLKSKNIITQDKSKTYLCFQTDEMNKLFGDYIFIDIVFDRNKNEIRIIIESEYGKKNADKQKEIEKLWNTYIGKKEKFGNYYVTQKYTDNDNYRIKLKNISNEKCISNIKVIIDDILNKKWEKINL